MSVLLCDARGDAIRRQHYIRTLLARQVDGFIILGDSNDLRPSLTRDIPVPVVYAYGESDDPADLSVLADDAGGARLAAEHLVVAGPPAHRPHHRRPGLPRRPRPRRRPHGRPRRSRAAPWSASRCSGSGRSAGAGTRRRLLAAHPDIDAIFCGNDQIASGVTEALRDLGRTFPDDVAVVGYDNWEVFATECRPPLTTVDLNLEQLGATAVRHLFAALDGDQHSGVIRQPGRLVVRESTGVAPAGR